MRSPLDDVPDHLSQQLTELFRELERGTDDQHAGSDLRLAAWNNDALTERRYKSAQAEKLIEEIRTIPGLDCFLLPKPFSALARVASKGPVVVLLAREDRGEAIIIENSSGKTTCIALDNISVAALQGLG